MRRKDRKTRCEKRKLEKFSGICKTFDAVQFASADVLNADDCIQEIRCNVWLEGLGLDAEYTSDFVCVKTDGSLLVRECVFRKYLTKPMTMKLLEESKIYWKNHGCTDWGLMIDEEK